jgi:hypothetical protein
MTQEPVVPSKLPMVQVEGSEKSSDQIGVWAISPVVAMAKSIAE